MKRYNTIRVRSIAAAICTVMLLASCVREGERDCMTTVTFEYTYNMLSADAFGGQVSKVTLYMFDENGVFMHKYASDPAADIENGFSFNIPNLPEGRYQFAAWAQSNRLSASEASFMVSDLSFGIEQNLSYTMRRNNGVQQYELNNLLVGATDVITAGGASERNVRVAMKKANKKIRVIMMPTSGGSDLDVQDFSYNIIDEPGNGRINYDFSLLPDEKTTYRPYFAANLLPDPAQVFDPGQIDRAAVVELNTSRLVVGNKPRLTIKTADEQQTIVDVDLVWLLSLTEMEQHRDWSLQEYLDRQDEYVITLFVSNGEWVQTTIIINGWVVNNLEIDI